ncbi:hypothetical protein DY218_10760 [Streptomyces triticagri]|uniref:Uncharacterized protein n=1 Tax=Streptomyces triticagri TaxID=2293568 RepID=A0A372M8C2_9ACTN|nr:hypothetical protein DY218_10760 [Streptomyces triticagri]
MRAAQVLTYVMGGLALLGTVVVGARYGAQPAGATVGSNIFTFVLLFLGLTYGKNAGSGTRIASIVLASLHILAALGAAANGRTGGLLPLLCAIALIVLLSQRSAGAWFKRPRYAPQPGHPGSFQ